MSSKKKSDLTTALDDLRC